MKLGQVLDNHGNQSKANESGDIILRMYIYMR